MTRAELRAQQVLNEARVKEPPVDVQRLAEELKVLVRYEPFDGDLSGMLFRDDARAIIGVNDSHSIPRKRFTIAHELGHYLLHRGRPMIVDKTVRLNKRDRTSSMATDREEIEANAFAAELLMPRRFVEREARRVLKATGTKPLFDHDVVDALAPVFEVSTQAMEYRLVNLGLLSPMVAGSGSRP